MRNQITLTFIFLIAITLLLIFNELVYRSLGLSGEITRKFAHFSATLSTITFPYLFTAHWYVLFLALFFLLFCLSVGTAYNSSRFTTSTENRQVVICCRFPSI